MTSRNDVFIDVAHYSLNKKGEELCGDKVEVFKSEDRTLIVLADGLGSGVKANILATLTSKIAITMLKKGADIEDVIDTIIHTLPVCKVREIAYATFSIIEIDKNLRCKIFESENPPFFFVRNGKIMETEKTIKAFHDKKVWISHLDLIQDDFVVVCSDGVIHAGVGNILNFGWEWENVATFLEREGNRNASQLSQRLIGACSDLYCQAPGDDTTVVTVKIRKPLQVMLFTGPPINPLVDEPFIAKFMKMEGKKVVCGGTAANIVSRVLNYPIKTSLNYVDKDVPPTAFIKDIDLVTEGVLTLQRTIQLIESWGKKPESVITSKSDGATRLFKLMIEESTHIDIWLGKAMNQAHQNADFPIELSMKVTVVKALVEVLRQVGKEVCLHYISEDAYENI
ncbi:conserved protein of unknown function [Petrocella atlantisensis]|uniref:PPM-type phosphatase domain-containing protein n=1 Tax=Petrocella atlantisensis TaxID=2173034 RepID=A0A3P7RWS2_9FIRM|nr:SpoIIE family protein phosphatase [Petrocella atlantisensis]VDN47122.1 conserved protein of unknown function [Petrocella atlantisensis]